MGQKVHPVGLRVGIIRDWEGRWFAEKDYATLLHEDLKIRRFIKSKLYNSGIARVEIERAANRVKVTIHTARPGMVIGRGGAEVENLRKSLEKLTDKQVSLNIAEVKVPDLNAQLVAENICFQLERRSSYRRAMKQAISRAMKLGALGVKIKCSGRLMGAEIARSEGYSEGKVPLHTLRADIDYGFAEANTTYGKIGVKVWINKGEVLPEKKAAEGEEGK
ncbi:MAG TPA: 30S ribosomal protein S3 [Firmicutes bacterium]|uniref:Small ribosomal subunit protein uS3 n=1 Tax=Capillibacterium thermochitinicola TaxID=2699427 RepID=A0A8J6HZB4_9FIRM|nr:30S ribosomal protein S3 [Capillibacterium thermochitinicola]MBA2132566.1 30S ribosomal protein S3 [Capillibacterium thermochitinicola]HHW11567.1 30S ribosomal protein S3 [Bacillota bacterium]